MAAPLAALRGLFSEAYPPEVPAPVSEDSAENEEQQTASGENKEPNIPPQSHAKEGLEADDKQDADEPEARLASEASHYNERILKITEEYSEKVSSKNEVQQYLEEAQRTAMEQEASILAKADE
ncbi:unnamed protein product, partial [Ostreobium quekettii]